MNPIFKDFDADLDFEFKLGHAAKIGTGFSFLLAITLWIKGALFHLPKTFFTLLLIMACVSLVLASILKEKRKLYPRQKFKPTFSNAIFYRLQLILAFQITASIAFTFFTIFIIRLFDH